ncbi:MAG: 50S ribosomal protein L29 [Firmicutes bacterium]|nr:50S ribosomal protein L29 [Bacillota bacterium]
MKLDELLIELKDLKERLFRLRFSHATGQLANPIEMASCKRDIARVKTILKEREANGENLHTTVAAAALVNPKKSTVKKEKVAK